MADNRFKQAMEADENVDMDGVYDALDGFKMAENIAAGNDPETEAVASAYMGKIFYKALKRPDKAKKYYNDCIRLLETLKPKVFSDKKWH